MTVPSKTWDHWFGDSFEWLKEDLIHFLTCFQVPNFPPQGLPNLPLPWPSPTRSQSAGCQSHKGKPDIEASPSPSPSWSSWPVSPEEHLPIYYSHQGVQVVTPTPWQFFHHCCTSVVSRGAAALPVCAQGWKQWCTFGCSTSAVAPVPGADLSQGHLAPSTKTPYVSKLYFRAQTSLTPAQGRCSFLHKQLLSHQ